MADHITKAEVRMYRLGTGDCFGIRFRKGNRITFKMIIDAGVINPGKSMLPFIEDLADWMNNQVDVLIVTHEHEDHVAAFATAKSIFVEQMDISQIWLAWTEDPQDPMAIQWKADFGKKKKALRFASNKLQEFANSEEIDKMHEEDLYRSELKEITQSFSSTLTDFANLHFTEVDHELAGMKVIKQELANDNISYLEPGDVIKNPPGAEGIKIYVLGPPRDIDAIKNEAGTGDEAYQHNKDLDPDDFLSFALQDNAEIFDQHKPFNASHQMQAPFAPDHPFMLTQNKWRSIEHDWLYSAGSLAMRLKHGINNLSLALAIEFEDSGHVMLFPGDAEIGSWESWQDIMWDEEPRNANLSFTDDLLERTIFYKVAHHLSHNGTALKNGLSKMTSKQLVAMATLSYQKILSGWKKTMPNRKIVQDLLRKTEGRLIISDVENLFYDLESKVPLQGKIEATRSKYAEQNKQFYKDFTGLGDTKGSPKDILYYQYVVRD